MWVKINSFPLYPLALWVKASSKTFDPSLLNKQSPGFELLNIYPIVLSSNGTTTGLSFLTIQAWSPLSTLS